MRNFKRITIWIFMSIILQFSAYFYIDKYYLSTNTVVKIKKIENKKQAEKREIDIIIPENAEHINVSFDGRYVSYYDGDMLKMIDTKTGEIKDICFEHRVKLSYYKWISDRNRMLIGEKHSTGNGYGFKLSYYDVDKDTKEEIKYLTWGDEDCEIEDIQESTLTNVIYVKVSRKEGRSRIYSINIMKNMKQVPTEVYMIGNIAILNHDDKLIYESKTYGNVFVTNNKKNKISIKGVENSRLLAIDEDDNVYIGQVKDNKIVNIYYGNLDKSTIEWNIIPLKEPVSRQSIYVSKKGKVLINDNLKGIMTEVATGKEIDYKGKFLQIYEGGVISLSEGKLIKNKF